MPWLKIFVLITLILVNPLFGCQENPLLNKQNLDNISNTGTLQEGPNSTGSLKEGPNSTGALKERYLLLTQNINGIENPLTPESIKSIEIVSKNSNQLIKNIDIKQNMNLFSIKADNLEITILFEGSGNFIVRSNKEILDLELKFNLKDFADPAIIPMLSGLTENNLRAVIKTGEDGKLIVTGGIKKENGELDATKVMFIVKADEKGKLLLSLIKPDGNKEGYILENLLQSIKSGNLISPDKIEMISDLISEQKKIEVQVQKLSSMAAFVGDWIYQGQGKELTVNIIDQGESRFSGNLTIDKVLYIGTGTYLPDAKNEFLFIDSSYNNSKIRVKIELLSPNTLGFTLVEVTDKDLLIYKEVRLILNRKIN